MNVPRFQAAKPAKIVDIDGCEAEKLLNVANRISKKSKIIRSRWR